MNNYLTVQLECLRSLMAPVSANMGLSLPWENPGMQETSLLIINEKENVSHFHIAFYQTASP